MELEDAALNTVTQYKKDKDFFHSLMNESSQKETAASVGPSGYLLID